MKRFELLTYVRIFNSMHAAQIAADKVRSSTGMHPQVDCAPFIELCKEIIAFGHAAGFRHTTIKASGMMGRMQVNPSLFDSSALAAEFRSLEGDVASDMMDCVFVQINSNVRGYFENPNFFGPEVLEAFPDCKDDIVNAANCIAVDLGTAAVFHLMRMAEIGLRAFARNLKLVRVVVDRSKGKTIPMEFAQWDKVLKQLPEKIEAKISLMKPGPRKQEAQEFYYSSLSEITAFKDAWRNHVMHVRRTYTASDADALAGHVGRFMQKLADHGIKA